MSDNWEERILSSYLKELRQAVKDRRSPTDPMLRGCESPIEQAFALSFDLLHGLWYGRPHLSAGTTTTSLAPQMFIQPQVQIEEYRVDFLCGWNIGDRKFTSVIVECDGHAFHEKTKQQAQRDKSRDRALALHAARVLRFTGSEIYKDPVDCAAQVIAVLDDLLWSWIDRGSGE